MTLYTVNKFKIKTVVFNSKLALMLNNPIVKAPIVWQAFNKDFIYTNVITTAPLCGRYYGYLHFM